MPPDKVVDVQSLAGDSIDNVPGVPGIGVKTAAELIKEYGDLDTLLARAGEIKQPKRREKLIEFADQARMSRELVRSKDDVPRRRCRSSDWACTIPSRRRCSASCATMEFNTLTRRIAETARRRAAADAREAPSATAAAAPGQPDMRTWRRRSRAADPRRALVPRPPRAARRRDASAARPARSHAAYETVTTLDRLANGSTRRVPQAASPSIPRRQRSSRCRPSSSASRWRSRRARPATCRSRIARPGGDLDSAAAVAKGRCRCGEALDAAEAAARGRRRPEDRPEHQVRLRCCCHATASTSAPIDDTHADLLRARRRARAHGMDDLAERHLGHTCIPFEQVLEHAPGAKKADKTFAQRAARQGDRVRRRGRRRHAAAVDGAEAAPRGRAHGDRVRDAGAAAASRSSPSMEARRHQGRPADPVAAVRRVRAVRRAAGGGDQPPRRPQVQPRLAEAARRIAVRPAGAAGRQAHQDRPVGDRRRTARDLAANEDLPSMRASSSTDARVAAADEAASRPIPTRCPPTSTRQTGRIHTSYALAATTTGRLVLVRAQPAEHPDPHQGGPRDPHGLHRRRRATSSISADYSQIELRVLAHIADIPQLQAGVRRRPRHPRHDGVGDVRRAGRRACRPRCAGAPRRSTSASSTASPPSASPTSSASRASEAGAYIKTYFERFPGIRDYMDATKKFAREHGYVETHLRPAHPLPARSTPRTRAMRGFSSAPRSTRRSRARPPTSSAAP